MTTTKYIRAMSFWETVGTMYRLYFKIMIPVFLLNIVIFSIAGSGFLVFIGPILIITSNVILSKPLKVWSSSWKGIFSGAFLKIAVSSIGYMILILILPMLLMANGSDMLVLPMFGYLYILLLPIWIFVPIIILLEKKGLRASVKRSFQIIRKNFSRILQMDIFIVVVFTLLAVLFALPGGNFMNGLSLSLGLFILSGFSCLPYVLVYYEYRARYEGYSEELLAQEMGYQPMEEMMSV